MRYFFILVALVVGVLDALTLKELKDMPKSRERDFYIWRFIQEQNTTKEQAKEAIKLRFNTNTTLKKAYFKKTGIKLATKRANSNTKDLKSYRTLINKLIKSGRFYDEWLKLSDSKKLKVFNLAGRANRALLNKKLNSKTYNSLTKYYAINQFIFRARREKLTNILDTIYNNRVIKGNKINYNNLMLIGYDCLRGNNSNAKYFFYSAIYKAKDRFHADKAIFWLYMATKDKKYLNKLASSYDFNMYRLIALDFLGKPYPMPQKEIKLKDSKPPIDITDPIAWARLKRLIFSRKLNLFNLAKKYNTIESAGYFYYILNKASRDTKQYFPIIYKEHIKDYSIDRQAFILALARQESRFIPASISRSFAVGLMQFMPFLVKHIAKVRKERVKLEDMFKPEVSIRFANTHLDYLYKWIHNPLFVAYAYNAGIGYTRRMLRRKDIFRGGKYEPYLSIELLENAQANEYGKKVLANYVIYRMLLKKPIKITTILKELTTPKLTDKFR
jgi:soluble lytic murein transglycosylase